MTPPSKWLCFMDLATQFKKRRRIVTTGISGHWTLSATIFVVSTSLAVGGCRASASTGDAAKRAHGGPTETACARQIHNAVDTGKVGKVAPACWHIGPVALGMSRAEVERALGPADYSAPDPDASHAGQPSTHFASAFYVFPRDLAARLAAHPVPEITHKDLEITFADDRVIRMDTTPPGVGWGPKCPLDHTISRRAGDPASVFPYSFATIRLGDSVASVARRLGKFARCGVAAPDLEYRCSSLPMTFGVGDDDKIGGIVIAASMDDLQHGTMEHFFASKDPKTCLDNGYRLLPKGPPGYESD